MTSSRALLISQRQALSSLAAQDDAQAFNAWATIRGARSAHTQDSYKRTAHRLLIWLHENHLTAGQLKIEHATAFLDHLSNPPVHWLKGRKVSADEVLLDTQLLTQPLSSASVGYTHTVLSVLFQWLQDAGYLQHNPFKLSKRPAAPIHSTQQRFLDLDCWEYLKDWLDTDKTALKPDTFRGARARWLLHLLYHTGIRRQECATGLMSDFVSRDGYWHLNVLGKGNRWRAVTADSALIIELRRYRLAVGMPSALPGPAEALPLIASSIDHTKPLTPRGLALALDAVLLKASRDCDQDHLREQLEKASTHWMRHTCATHRLMAGASLETTQDELGHRDPRTTRIYAKTQSEQRILDAEKLANLRSKPRTISSE